MRAVRFFIVGNFHVQGSIYGPIYPLKVLRPKDPRNWCLHQSSQTHGEVVLPIRLSSRWKTLLAEHFDLEAEGDGACRAQRLDGLWPLSICKK
jgi:hypothetical protein